MAFFLAPLASALPQLFTAQGAVLNGGKVYFFAAGTTTPQDTFTDSTGAVPNSHPIVLDAGGRASTGIYLTEGLIYKVRLFDSAGNLVDEQDNVVGIATATTTSEWQSSGLTTTYISASQFSVPGDQTTDLHKRRRLKIVDSGGTKYGTVTASAFSTLTTVTVEVDAGGSLANPLTSVSWSIIRADNPSIDADMVHRKSSDAVASAATCDIWSIQGDYVHVTGTTGITSFGTAPYAGGVRTVIFDGVLQITHNATTLQCPGGQSITTAAGDRAVVRADTTANMVIVAYIPATSANPGKSLAPNPFFQVDQRVGSSLTDDTYGPDRWYALTQTAAITYAMQTLQENGQASNVRLTQSNAAAQRFGLATIIEAKDSQPLRGKVVTFRPRVRISNSQALRVAVLEWTSTADSVTSDVVNDWTSGTYTAGNFFLAANLTVTGVGSKTPGAATWTDMDCLTVTVGNSCNNLVLFAWTEGTAAQNVTLDIGKVRFVVGADASEIYIPTYEEALLACQRHFWKTFNQATAPAQNVGVNTGELQFTIGKAGATANQGVSFPHPVLMRVAPTATLYNPTAANAQANDTGAGDWTVTTTANLTERTFRINGTGNAGGSIGNMAVLHVAMSADL